MCVVEVGGGGGGGSPTGGFSPEVQGGTKV